MPQWAQVAEYRKFPGVEQRGALPGLHVISLAAIDVHARKENG
jgi:hypothetical protein